MRRQELSSLNARVDTDLVRQALGGPEAVPAPMAPRLAELIEQVLEAATPSGQLVLAKLTDKHKEQIRFEGGQTLHGLGVAGLLRKCERLAAFAVSLGPGPEALMRQATEQGHLLDLTLLDAVASEAVEDLAEQAQDQIEKLAAQQDCATTRRISPGYCDWALQEQIVLNELVEFERAGIQLTPACIMIPEKSISAVMGIGPRGSRGKKIGQAPACGRCPKKDDCPGPKAH